MSAEWALNNLNEDWTRVLPAVIEARKNPQILNKKEVLKELVDKLEEPIKHAVLSLEERLKTKI